MSWNLECDSCGENLGKTTENYKEIRCSNCGDVTINPDDRYLRDEEPEQETSGFEDQRTVVKPGDAICPNCGESAGPAYLNDDEINCYFCGEEFNNPPKRPQNNTGSYANRFKR